ncbi:MAG TPA: polysaccharide deacetylase family protein [Gemmatimonadaceae bacterium]|nr:polysaccharide deacetylase family protein [Gemmatimonadaceae bacterium]
MGTRKARKVASGILAMVVGVPALAWASWTLSDSRSFQFFGKLVTRVETDDSIVALTFDDGPIPPYTDSVLAMLADANAVATFFVVGQGAAQRPELTRRLLAAGHELGNHSYSHKRLIFKSPGGVRRELERTDSVIRAAGQSSAVHFRPPYGKRLVVLPWILSRTGRTTILWDLEPDSYPDVARDPDRIVDHVMTRVRPGSIILLHVETRARAPARAALPKLLTALRAKGYELVTVSELMRRAKGQEPAV